VITRRALWLTIPVLRQANEGHLRMLQWNQKRTALLVMALLIVIAAVGGCIDWDWGSLNITW